MGKKQKKRMVKSMKDQKPANQSVQTPTVISPQESTPVTSSLVYKRLIDGVEIDEKGCWIWQKCIANTGYGNISVKNKTHTTHRLMYELIHGEIKGGLHVLHKCDIRSCINPDHLFLGTNTDNINDMFAKGRNPSRRGENSGRSKLTEDVVRKIRHLRGSYPHITYVELGHFFGVSKSAIQHVVNGHNWSHVA